MTTRKLTRGALQVISAIAWREAVSATRGLGIYLAATAAMLVATWLLLIDVRALQVAGILVPDDPFRAPLEAALLVLSLYFAFSAAVSTARDRESGTLEVLFYSPVDEITYVLGKNIGLLCAYLVVLPLVAVTLVLVSVVSGFSLPSTLPLSLVMSLVPAANVVAFGTMLAIGTSRVRTAVVVLCAAALLLIGGTLAYSIVLLVPIDNPSSPVVTLRDTLAGVNTVLRWVSPFANFERIVAEGVAIGAWRTAIVGLALSLLATAALVAISALWLRLRGVQRAGE